MKKNVFIGGAWPYANNSLHVGHLAALLPGDIIARYYRQKKDNVIYVSGTDSHGTPITLRAKKNGVDPKSIASHYHEEFQSNFNSLDFSYDVYTSTMTTYHADLVKYYLHKIKDNNYIYEKKDMQDYCDNCKIFLSDREIIGTCPHCGGIAKGDQCDECSATLNASELSEKKCSYCNSKTIKKENRHLYFSLAMFQDKIKKLNNEKEGKWRNNATSETNKFLEMGLIDRVITRQLSWGVDVPFEGFEDKKVYVWIEAVLGYLTAGQKAAEEKQIDFNSFMRGDNAVSYYVHGKDNIPFHTVIFPSLLMAIDESINLPNYIVSCEYVNMNNEKMSKSKGNLISVNNLIELLPKDSIRYYFLANGPENKDINFSLEDVVQVHNKFLVGVFGNFVNRNLSYINKKFEGKIPNGVVDDDIKKLTNDIFENVGEYIQQGKIKQAIETAVSYVSAGNKFYDDKKPWIQVNENINEFNNTTYTCVYMIANMSNLLCPFIPETCNKIKKKLNLSFDSVWKSVDIGENLIVMDNDLLFERLKIEDINSKYLSINNS